MHLEEVFILAIESSCDDTAAAVLKNNTVLSNVVARQSIHEEYGGVVPELASRDHIQRAIPLIKEALNESGIKLNELTGIAYTAGPGLSGALLVGGSIAQSLAWGLGIPALGVHHMEGHLLAPLLEVERPEFPFVALLVSGGHTLLVDVPRIGEYKILGESLDDAVGEGFDKTAKILGLGYPGGPALANLAKQGDKNRFTFPRPMTDRPGLDFSFSGLKTYARNTFIDFPEEKANIAKAFEVAATETLTIKCNRALKQTGYKTLVVAGGVSANLSLRESLNEMTTKNNASVFYPALDFCTDNGAMIALAGHYRFLAGQSNQNYEITIKPRWSLEELLPVD